MTAMNSTLLRFWLTMISCAALLELFDLLFDARSIPDQGIVALNLLSLLAWFATRRPRGSGRSSALSP
jgi:hypothetical protein